MSQTPSSLRNALAAAAFAPGSVQAAIVDLDGTMVDTLGDFSAALDLMLADLALPAVPRDAVSRMIGKGSEHLIHSVLARAEADPALYDEAFARYQHHYPSVNGRHSALFPGVEAGLRHLAARGIALACVTNKPTAFAVDLLQAKGLARYFSKVFGGDAFARKKPDPLPLLETCKALDSTPARTLVVGDSRNDAEAARAAGCPVLLVRYGYNHGEPVEAVDADGLLDSMADLQALVR